MKSIAEMIADHPLFAGLGPEAIETIGGCGRNVVFEPGAFLFREGDPTDRFYLLRAGRVALETFVPGRGALAFQTLAPGDFVGVSWLVPPFRASFDAHALEPVRTTEFDAQCLRRKCEADPALGYALMMRFVPALIARLKASRLQTVDVYAAPAERDGL